MSVVEPTEPTDEELPDLTIEPTLVATARRRYGAVGAIMGAGLLGIEQALGLRKVKEEAPIVIAADDRQPRHKNRLAVTRCA